MAKRRPAPSRGVALKKIGSFDSPVYVTGAPGFPSSSSSSSRKGRSGPEATARAARGPSSTSAASSTTAASAACSRSPSRPTTRSSKRFYVYYTDGAGNIQIDEFRRSSATRAAFGSRRPVITIPHPVNANHNGGQLQFLGDLLYFGTGDGGSGGDPPNNAQNKDVLLGKLLRIDPRAAGGKPYSVPGDNPFVGKPGRDEIYSYGLRNPFRFSFDTTHGAAADRDRRRRPERVRGDRLHDRRQGRTAPTSAGTRSRASRTYTDENSGTPDPGGTVKPIFAYPHSRGGSCSIIGGYVARDRRLPGLRGRYVYADLCEGAAALARPPPESGERRPQARPQVSSPSSFGEDQRHRLYVTSLEGPVYRLVPR